MGSRSATTMPAPARTCLSWFTGIRSTAQCGDRRSKKSHAKQTLPRLPPSVAQAMAAKSSAKDATAARLRRVIGAQCRSLSFAEDRVPFARSLWRVIAPDLRGYGESSIIPGNTTLDVFASDVATLLDQLNIQEIVIGGLSMGGQTVIAFCPIYPDRGGRLSLPATATIPH